MVHHLEVLVPDVNSVKKVTQQYFMTDQPAFSQVLAEKPRKRGCLVDFLILVLRAHRFS